MVHETVKMGADNPDNYYQTAAISGAHRYRLSGTRGTVKYLGFATQRGNYGQGRGMPPTGHVDATGVVSMAHPLQMRRAMRSRAQRVAARHALRLQMPWRPERLLIADGGAEVDRILRDWSVPANGFPDDEASARYRAALSIWPAPHCSLEYHRWAFRSLLRPDGARFAAKMAPAVEVPVLQVHGEQDPAVLLDTALASREHVAGSYRLAVLPGVGHFPQEEHPEQVARTLTSWLADVTA